MNNLGEAMNYQDQLNDLHRRVSRLEKLMAETEQAKAKEDKQQ